MSKGVYTSRLKNAKRNIISGFVKTFVVIILNFVIRTAVLYYLGAEYQGLSGLFTSILQVLNLTDLGFSSAVTFILYKPIADNDIDTICAIVAFLKKAYKIIGIVILVSGLILMPFLPQLISGDCPSDINIYILFSLYLFNAVISYLLFAYKSTLLTAMQREDIVSNVYSFTTLVSKGIQFLILLLFRNYYLYILIIPIGSIINNILLHVCSLKAFPDIIPKGEVNSQIKNELVKQVKAVFIGRISDIARNSFDNIVLSAFLGLVVVAVYDNYYYIFSAVYGFMGMIAHAIRASVGNSIVKETSEKNYHDCMKFSFIFMWIVGWCSICMCCLYQPFMLMWMKGNLNLLLSIPNMLLFCVYFYAISLTYTKGIYLEARGLFWECRQWYIFEAVGNLVLNIILGYFFGVTGILVATIITILIFNYIGGTLVLFKYYFKIGFQEFFASHIKYFVVTVLNGLVTYLICSLIAGEGVVNFVIKLVICILLPNSIYLGTYLKTKMFNESFNTFKRVLRK